MIDIKDRGVCPTLKELGDYIGRSEEHTSELQSQPDLKYTLLF